MRQLVYALLLLSFLTACSSGSEIRKEAWENSFVKRELPTEKFNLYLGNDTVVESRKGSTLFVPSDAFLDGNGKVYSGKVDLELAEITTLAEMVAHNIPSSSDDGALNIHGILKLMPYGEGKKLTINPESAPYLEITVDDDVKDLTIYEGKEDENGYIKWENPKKAPQHLIPQPFNTLDFLPNAFEETLINYLPYKGYKTPTKSLKDSLYFALRAGNFISETIPFEGGDSDTISLLNCEGLKPAMVKTIQEDKFSNTFLATKAFERRLKVIIEAGRNDFLKMYIQNLDKALWQVDEMVANSEISSKFKTQFQAFSAEKLTNVKGADAKMTKKLGEFYQKRLAKNEKALKKAHEEYLKELKRKSDLAEKKREEYRALLKKRMRYRLRKHGIRIKKNAPHTLCEVLNKKIASGELEPFELDVTVENGKDFDRVQVYVFDPSIKYPFALLSDDKVYFNGCYNDDWVLIMKTLQQAYVTVVAYKDEKKYFTKTSFTLQKINNIKIKIPLDDLTEKQLKKELVFFDKGARRFNKIEVDLEYQEFFAKEKERLQKLEQERVMMMALYMKAFPRCLEGSELLAKGKSIFENHCFQCHAVHEQVVGPALRHLLGRRSFDWIVSMTRYPQKLIDSGDPIGQELLKKYKQYMPNHDFLTTEDVLAICLYIEQQSNLPSDKADK